MIRPFCLFALVLFAFGAQAQEGQVVIDISGSSTAADGAVLRALDRINGAVEDLDVAPGQTVKFERLEITLVECRYPENHKTTEAFAHLKVKDVREPLDSFVGWMFASSPALSALDHPRYDVWVLNCKI